MEGKFSRIFPMGVENWFKFEGVLNNRGFEKSGVKVQCYREANPRETTTGSSYREVRETKGSRNRDSTVCSDNSTMHTTVIQRLKVSGRTADCTLASCSPCSLVTTLSLFKSA